MSPEVEIVHPEEKEPDTMAEAALASSTSDISPTGREVLISEGIAAHQILMTEAKGNISHDMGLLRKIALKKFDEVGSIESRAVDKVLGKLGD